MPVCNAALANPTPRTQQSNITATNTIVLQVPRNLCSVGVLVDEQFAKAGAAVHHTTRLSALQMLGQVSMRAIVVSVSVLCGR